MQNNNRSLITIIVFLGLFSLSTIGTIVYHIYFTKESSSEVIIEQIDVPDKGLGRFFRQQLNLSHKQHIQFRQFRQQFHKKANIVTDKLQLRRNEFMDELGKERSDTERLHKLSLEIGDLHAELKHLTFEYYLQMKDICNKEQQKKLHSIFQSMMNPVDNDAMPGSIKDEIQNKQLLN